MKPIYIKLFWVIIFLGLAILILTKAYPDVSGSLYVEKGIDVYNTKIGVQLNINHNVFGIPASLFGGWETGLQLNHLQDIQDNINYDLYNIGYRFWLTDTMQIYLDHFCQHPENQTQWKYDYGTYIGARWEF